MFIDLREREKGAGREEERERQRNIYWLPPIRTPTVDHIRNLGMCPDQKSNPQPFGVWDHTPTKWATWPGKY